MGWSFPRLRASSSHVPLAGWRGSESSLDRADVCLLCDCFCNVADEEPIALLWPVSEQDTA